MNEFIPLHGPTCNSHKVIQAWRGRQLVRASQAMDLVSGLGAIFSHIGGRFDRIEAAFGPSWAIVGVLLSHLGATSGQLEPPRGHLGAILGLPCAILGHLGSRSGQLGLPRRHFGACSSPLGVTLSHPGAILSNLATPKSESAGYAAMFWAFGAASSSSKWGKLGAQNPSASSGTAPGTVRCHSAPV